MPLQYANLTPFFGGFGLSEHRGLFPAGGNQELGYVTTPGGGTLGTELGGLWIFGPNLYPTSHPVYTTFTFHLSFNRGEVTRRRVETRLAEGQVHSQVANCS